MNDQTKELVAIGVSVAVHCQPCLTHHLGVARQLDVSEEDILAAIEMGRQVERGAGLAMKAHLETALAGTASGEAGGACCTPGSDCCG